MDLMFTISIVRCSLDIKDCQRFVAMPATLNLCRLLEEKEKFYTVMTDAIHPRLKCPIEAGNYTLDKITVNLKVISGTDQISSTGWKCLDFYISHR